MSKKFNAAGRLTTLIALCLCFVQFIPAQNSATAPTTEQITAKIDEYMNAAVKVEGFSGSILVARDGKTIVNKGYAMANIELNVQNTPDTVFRLGSITKQFTAMAIMMLAERGKLNVNDPACKYLTDCPAAWQPITVRNLLTHTGGIPNYTSFPDFAKVAVLPTTNTAMTALLRDKPLDFAVGEKYAYSNSGYYLLGAIIERVSGKPYADFLQENIFAPLGMKQTGYDVSARIIKNRAAGYARQGGEFVNASYMDMTIPGAAGAIYSTTGDLLLWDQALYTEKLVSRKTLDETFTPFKSEYGYGWSIGKKFDRQVIAHGGGIYGFATHIARFPADKVTVIVLSNVQGAPAGRISNDLAAIVFGAAYEIPKERKEIAVEPKILGKYVGQYELAAPKIVINILLENGKLFGQVGGQSKFALSAESEIVFFSKDVNLQITFTKDAQGQTTGLTFSQGGVVIPGQKIK
ncbi:MAG: serine hydrolase [Acidobacteriota bacterium]|nr:serine hydrolase [Acidobacteriota bacterium]